MKRKLQVFVSSTYLDLKDERQAAVSAILKSGHIPAGMELFTAGDKSQMKTIERWIDESDIYMLILGGRYGSIESTTNLSYTELEYDYAVQAGMPTFAVVITEEALERKVKAGGLTFIEGENPAALKLFRQKVLSNMSSFFSEPKDIALCIYESMSDFSSNMDLKGWISAADVNDTKQLQEEIKRLREENAGLQEIVKKHETMSKVHAYQKVDEYNEKVQVLKGIEIKVPENISPTGKELKTDLFRISYNNRDSLITGVNNSYDITPTDSFWYYNVFPKLQAHGLADNERVPGVRYRRSFLNRAGQDFFAEMEKRIVLSQSTTPSTTGALSDKRAVEGGSIRSPAIEAEDQTPSSASAPADDSASVSRNEGEPAKARSPSKSKRKTMK